jgi:hypothetical protein
VRDWQFKMQRGSSSFCRVRGFPVLELLLAQLLHGGSADDVAEPGAMVQWHSEYGVRVSIGSQIVA